MKMNDAVSNEYIVIKFMIELVFCVRSDLIVEKVKESMSIIKNAI